MLRQSPARLALRDTRPLACSQSYLFGGNPLTREPSALSSPTYASLKVYLSALRFHQISNGKGDPRIPDMPRLEYILKGIRRDGVALGSASRKERQPITPQLVKKIFAVWKDWSDLKSAKMLWAAACLAFFAFLRVGEFTSPTANKFDSGADLSVSDVSVDNSRSPAMVFVHLKRSKTD